MPLNEQQIDVQIQQNVNLRRGADLLLARNDVDPRRLAYVGTSCDASASAFLSGLDRRFKAFVIMAATSSSSRQAEQVPQRKGESQQGSHHNSLGRWPNESGRPLGATTRATRKGFCTTEQDLFRTVLGEDVTVERVEHIVAGDRRCAYRIKQHLRICRLLVLCASAVMWRGDAILAGGDIRTVPNIT